MSESKPYEVSITGSNPTAGAGHCPSYLQFDKSITAFHSSLHKQLEESVASLSASFNPTLELLKGFEKPLASITANLNTWSVPAPFFTRISEAKSPWCGMVTTSYQSMLGEISFLEHAEGNTTLAYCPPAADVRTLEFIKVYDRQKHKAYEDEKKFLKKNVIALESKKDLQGISTEVNKISIHTERILVLSQEKKDSARAVEEKNYSIQTQTLLWAKIGVVVVLLIWAIGILFPTGNKVTNNYLSVKFAEPWEAKNLKTDFVCRPGDNF